MLARVIDAWMLWVLLVGFVGGGLVTGLVMARLPRGEDDVSLSERPAEAAWISGTIERHGGIAPASLVEEVLDLHQAYLADARLARAARGVVPPDARTQPPLVPGGPVGLAPRPPATSPVAQAPGVIPGPPPPGPGLPGRPAPPMSPGPGGWSGPPPAPPVSPPRDPSAGRR